jgi:glycosyltransferase involved in cell wall biosynthesis
LKALSKEVGVESQVIFHDRFVSPEEMAEFIGAADIYITPYRHEAQVVSGTLAYALGAGKAIISTPYWHAIELLDDRRGALVPFQNPEAIAQKTIELLTTPALRHAMRKRAYLFALRYDLEKSRAGLHGGVCTGSQRPPGNSARSVFGSHYQQIAESASRIKTQSREYAD